MSFKLNHKNSVAAKIHSDISPKALEMWNPGIKAAASDPETTITIYGIIGEDWWTGEGVTVNRVDAALRYIGDKPVTVYINSPGGDYFEGIAIYNRLREHTKKITVKIVGIAASAASVIAMAGDERYISPIAFLMIHNCWSCVCGNRHVMREVADQFEEFDVAAAELYANTSSGSVAEMSKMMDEETYIRGSRAVELGLCTSLLDAREVAEQEDDTSAQASAVKVIDIAMAKAGMPRNKRRELFASLKPGTHNAAGGGTHNAAPTYTPGAIAQPDLSASLKAANNIIAQLGGHHG